MASTTITLDEQQNTWVQAQIASGKYHNENELFRDLIQTRQKHAQIEASLIEAESSIVREGFSELSIDDVWAKAKSAFQQANT